MPAPQPRMHGLTHVPGGSDPIPGLVLDGVDTIAKAGATPLTGNVTLSAGTNVTLTQAGHNIAIAATGGGTTAMPFSISGVLAVANGLLRWYPLTAGTISQVHCAVGAAPAGSGVTVRLKKNGSSVGTGTIAAGGFTTTFVPSPASFTVGQYFTVDVTAVGSTTPGSALVVQLEIS